MVRIQYSMHPLAPSRRQRVFDKGTPAAIGCQTNSLYGCGRPLFPLSLSRQTKFLRFMKIPDTQNRLIVRYAKTLIKTYQDQLDDLSLWRYRVHSTMFIASATVLTLVCSLGLPTRGTSLGIGNQNQSWYSWLNIAIVWLCGICLIALLVALYRNILATRKATDIVADRWESLKVSALIPSDVAFDDDGECTITVTIAVPRFFLFFERVAYPSFVLMVVGLVVRYGILAAIYPVLP